MELIFLEAGEHDLREMAVAVVLRLRQRDRILQPLILQVLRHLRREHLRLVTRLVEREEALDGDANRPHRHDDQDDTDADGRSGHSFNESQ